MAADENGFFTFEGKSLIKRWSAVVRHGYSKENAAEGVIPSAKNKAKSRGGNVRGFLLWSH